MMAKAIYIIKKKRGDWAWTINLLLSTGMNILYTTTTLCGSDFWVQI